MQFLGHACTPPWCWTLAQVRAPFVFVVFLFKLICWSGLWSGLLEDFSISRKLCGQIEVRSWGFKPAEHMTSSIPFAPRCPSLSPSIAQLRSLSQQEFKCCSAVNHMLHFRSQIIFQIEFNVKVIKNCSIKIS